MDMIQVYKPEGMGGWEIKFYSLMLKCTNCQKVIFCHMRCNLQLVKLEYILLHGSVCMGQLGPPLASVVIAGQTN
jgi:hypothetical protein